MHDDPDWRDIVELVWSERRRLRLNIASGLLLGPFAAAGLGALAGVPLALVFGAACCGVLFFNLRRSRGLSRLLYQPDRIALVGRTDASGLTVQFDDGRHLALTAADPDEADRMLGALERRASLPVARALPPG